MASETIGFGGLELRFLQTKEGTAGSLDAFEMTVQPNARMPVAHYHENWDETIYGLSGASTWRVDGQDIVLKPGQSVFIKRGIVHAFRNDTQEAASSLCILTPGVLGPGYFREMAAALAGGAPDPAKMKEIMLRHGLHPAAVSEPVTSRRDARRRSKYPCRRGPTGSAPSNGPSGAWARARESSPRRARARARE